MRKIAGTLALAVLLACHKQAEEAPVFAPTLANRAQIIAVRDRMARSLVRPGDTLTIYVFMMIDAQGVVHQPEVKQQADPQAIDSAVTLVRMMHFRPAQQDGKPKQVLLKVPVRFTRPLQP